MVETRIGSRATFFEIGIALHPGMKVDALATLLPHMVPDTVRMGLDCFNGMGNILDDLDE